MIDRRYNRLRVVNTKAIASLFLQAHDATVHLDEDFVSMYLTQYLGSYSKPDRSQPVEARRKRDVIDVSHPFFDSNHYLVRASNSLFLFFRLVTYPNVRSLTVLAKANFRCAPA
jgi:hypothetical protein